MPPAPTPKSGSEGQASRVSRVNKQPSDPRTVPGSNLLDRLAARPARIPSKVLLGGDNSVVIVHGQEEYLLRVTDDGKLVLSR